MQRTPGGIGGVRRRRGDREVQRGGAATAAARARGATSKRSAAQRQAMRGSRSLLWMMVWLDGLDFLRKRKIERLTPEFFRRIIVALPEIISVNALVQQTPIDSKLHSFVGFHRDEDRITPRRYYLFPKCPSIV